MPPPQHERGLWNFLTWSFFISQVLTAGSFFGAPARAAGDADNASTSTDHSGAQAASGSLQAVAGVHANSPEDGTSTVQASSELLTQHALGDHAGGPQAIAGLQEPGGNHGAGSAIIGQDLGLDPGGAAEPASDTREIAPEPLVSTLDQVVAPVVGVVDDVVGSLDAVLDHAVAPVLGTVGTVVGSVEAIVDHTVAPVVGVLGAVAESVDTAIGQAVPLVGTAVDHVVSPLTEVIGAVVGAQDIVASGGNIVLPELSLVGPLAVDALFSGGSYTPYNLALNAEPATAQSLAAGNSASIVDAILGDQHSESGPYDDHHGAPTTSAMVPSALEELHLRGVDGLV
jgi:hypothetical protein